MITDTRKSITSTATRLLVSIHLIVVLNSCSADQVVQNPTGSASNNAEEQRQSSTAAPFVSPAPGIYSTAQSITLTTETKDARIHYTADGTHPTTESPIYTQPIRVAKNTVIKSIAVAASLPPSEVNIAVFGINEAMTSPKFSPQPGAYGPAQRITIDAASPESVIYFTTDGSTPTRRSQKYSTPIVVDESVTIKAIATAPNQADSLVSYADYVINGRASAPVFSANSGEFGTPQSLTIDSPTEGATIHYTTNGESPTRDSEVYDQPISVISTTTVKAIATKPGYTDSEVATTELTINGSVATPKFSKGDGSYNKPIQVELTSETDGATIYYSLTREDETESWLLYREPISITGETIVKAYASKSNFTDSNQSSATYHINPVTDPAVLAFPNLADYPNVTWTPRAMFSLAKQSELEIYIGDTLAGRSISDSNGTNHFLSTEIRSSQTETDIFAKHLNDSEKIKLGPLDLKYPLSYAAPGGINGEVHAMALDMVSDGCDQGCIIYGGSFTTAGMISAQNIARQKPNGQFEALGSGINGTVKSLAVDSHGIVYAGGIFSKAGEAAANNIAYWDGQNWMSMGDGVKLLGYSSVYQARVLAMAADRQRRIYVGGTFNQAGNRTNAFGLARWDYETKSWDLVNEGFQNRYNWAPQIDAIAVHHTVDSLIVYFGGDEIKKTDLPDSPTSGLWKWDESNWSAVTVNDTTSFKKVNALTIAQDGTVYVAEDYNSLYQSTSNARFEKIATFSPRQSSAPRNIEAIRVHEKPNNDIEVIVAGRFKSITPNSGNVINANSIAKWSRANNTWTGFNMAPIVPENSSRGLYDLLVGADNYIYVGGESQFFINLSGMAATVGKYDEATEKWHTITTSDGVSPLGTDYSNPHLEYAFDGTHGYVYTGNSVIKRWRAGGDQSDIQTINPPAGKTLRYIKTSDTNRDKILIAASADAYTPKSFAIIDKNFTSESVLQWIPPPEDANSNPINFNEIVAFSTKDGINQIDSCKYIYKNGQWTERPNSKYVSDVVGTCKMVSQDSEGNLYAIGQASNVWRAAKWNINDESWSRIGQFEGGDIYDIAVYSNPTQPATLYLAGTIKSATPNFNSQSAVNGIVKWTGTSWSSLGMGILGIADSMALDSKGNLYIGGNFHISVGENELINNVAMWDGSRWHGLDSGTNGPVKELVVDETDNLYVVGYFTAVSNKVRPYIAFWVGKFKEWF